MYEENNKVEYARLCVEKKIVREKYLSRLIERIRRKVYKFFESSCSTKIAQSLKDIWLSKTACDLIIFGYMENIHSENDPLTKKNNYER